MRGRGLLHGLVQWVRGRGSSVVISANQRRSGKPSRSPKAALLFRRRPPFKSGRDRLQERGQWNDTALIVCSDHGESFYEHDIFADYHGLYVETREVPLVVTTPETRGTRHNDLVQLPDIAPTITHILGVDSSLGAFGPSLLPLLEGSKWGEREAVIAEEAYTQRRTAVRTSDGKYIQPSRTKLYRRMGWNAGTVR